MEALEAIWPRNFSSMRYICRLGYWIVAKLEWKVPPDPLAAQYSYPDSLAAGWTMIYQRRC